MGKLVEATQVRYYGNVRRRVGEQFVMADSDFKKHVAVLGRDGKPVMKDGEAQYKEEDYVPMGVVVVEDGHEDPVFESEADLKKKQAAKAVKRKPVKKEADDLRQGGAFDAHVESGIQVTGQVAPARPAVSSQASADVVVADEGKDDGKKKSGKSVI